MTDANRCEGAGGSGTRAERERAAYVLDCSAMTGRDSAYDQILAALPVPEWCGRNLDALSDALWELEPCDIRLKSADCLDGREPLGSYGSGLLQVFLDVAIDRGDDLNLLIER